MKARLDTALCVRSRVSSAITLPGNTDGNVRAILAGADRWDMPDALTPHAHGDTHLCTHWKKANGKRERSTMRWSDRVSSVGSRCCMRLTWPLLIPPNP